jgi:hypothetical protein
MITLEKSPVLLAINASDEKHNNDFIVFALNVEKAYKKTSLDLDVLKECFDIVECFDDNKQKLFALLLSDYSYSYNIESLVNYAENDACLFEGSASDYAYELINDCYDTKSMGALANYIDYDSFGRDLLLNNEIVELGYNLVWTNPNDIY